MARKPGVRPRDEVNSKLLDSIKGMLESMNNDRSARPQAAYHAGRNRRRNYKLSPITNYIRAGEGGAGAAISSKGSKPRSPPSNYGARGPIFKGQFSGLAMEGAKSPPARHVKSVAAGPKSREEAKPQRRVILPPKVEYASSVRGYLLEVRYEGSIGRVALLFYDEEEDRLVKWVDRTGHRPYFLVEGDPDSLKRVGLNFDRHESFRQYDLISKFHPVERRKVKVVKVVVDDPLAVRTLRSWAEEKKVRYWEADIKYHQNYIYDLGLVPGMKYEADGSHIKPLWSRASPETIKMIESAFGDDDLKELAKNWIPQFEEPPPRPGRISIDIEVYSPKEAHLPDPDKAYYPVISIALSSDRGDEKVLLLYREGVEFSELPEGLEGVEIEVYDDERAMLVDAIDMVSRYPVVVTFNGDGFDLPYLYNRLIALGLDPEEIPLEYKQDRIVFSGCIHLDLMKLFDVKALQAYAFGNKYREKSLDSIAEALLGEGKVLRETSIPELSLGDLALYNYTDARLTLRLLTFGSNLIWNLVILLARISKLGIEDVTRSQVSSWVRSLLYWEHRRRGWLIPSREEIAEKSGGRAVVTAITKNKKYKGALVLEPPQGIFFNVVVLDFASLYPSIIWKWNLSYETVDNENCASYDIVPEVGHRVCRDFRGITSQLVGLLRDFRVKLYKKKAKSSEIPEEERLWYDTVQAAMKVYINASYGVFGTESFPLYSLPVAESVTAISRMILASTEKKARELNLYILYGDTDSIFLWDPPKEGLDEIMRFVEDEFGLELEVDKEFKLVLFSGLKKNYMGITDDGRIVIKGLVGKKSNTPEFIKEEFARAVEILRNIQSPDDIERVLNEMRRHVQGIYDKIKNKTYMLDEFAIKVMLSKDPSEYKKNTPQHVKAALMLIKEGASVGKGDMVSYVKVRGGPGVKPVELAKLSEVDPSKYLEYVKTAFEQILLAFGVSWEEIAGVKSLSSLFR